MDKTIIQDYGKYLSKVNPEKGRRRAQEQEAKWAEERRKREEEKLTEAYQRELRERAEQAARERRKVEKATAAFNAASDAHGTKSNAPDKRQLREIREGISVIANPTTPFRSPDELMAKKYGGQDIRRVLPELETKDVINRRYGIGENPNYSNYGYAYKTHDLSDEEKVRQWTNPDYKLSDREKREAKDILKREKERRNNVIKQGSIDAMIPGTEEYNRLQQYNNLEAKTKGEFARGALLPFLKVSNLATKGVEKLMGDSEDAQNAKSILDEQMQNAFKQDRLAAAQSPVKHGAGNFAGTAAMYSATSPMFDAAAEGLGVSSTLGKILVNQAAQNAQDVALDTAPERQMLRDMGMSEEEINRETLKNVRNNAIGNVAMPVLGKLASTAVDAFKGNLPQLGDSMPKVDMDEVRQGIERLQGINQDALKQAAQNGDIRTLNRLTDQTIPALKQESVDLPQFKRVETLGDTATNAPAIKQIEDAVTKQSVKPIELSDTDLSALKDEAKKLKQSFRGKANWVKDSNNKYAKSFVSALDELANNPNADTYTKARKALSDYIDNSSTKNMKSNSGAGGWYVKRFDNYDPDTKVSPFTNAFEEFANKYGLTNTAPNMRQIEDAVQKQTAEAQKVLKEAEPIEEWTRKQLSSTGRETAKDIKVLAQEAALRNKDESTYKAIDNLVKKSDDLDNAITSGADASEIRKIYSDVKKAYNTLNGKLKAVGDNSLEAKKSTYFGKNSEFNVDDILKRKPADSDDFSELFDDTVPADNVKPTSVGDSTPEAPNTPNMKVSDAYENTLKNSGIMTDDEIAKRTVPENFSYESHSEMETMAEGARMREAEGEDFVPNRLEKEGFTAADVDGMMQAWRDKVAEARAVEEAGEDSDALWEEASTIFRKIQQESSRGGAALQALAKWSRNTPEGMLSEAEHIVNKRIKTSTTGDSMAMSKAAKDKISAKIDKAAVEKQKPFMTQWASDLKDYTKRVLQSVDASGYKGNIDNVRKLNSSINDFEKALDDGNIGRIQETYTALKRRAANMSDKGLYIHAENKEVEDAIKNLTKQSRVGGFAFSPDFQKKFINEASAIQDLRPNSREFKEAYARLGKMVNEEIRRNTSAPKLWGQRLTSYLMNNMLGNFRTLITRNAGGNVGLAAAEQFVERPLAAGIDRLVAKKTGMRTQAGLSKEALYDYLTGFKKGLAEEAADVKSGLHTSRSGEVDIADAIARNSNVFKTDSKNKLLKALSGLASFKNEAVAHGLSVGDRPFYEAVYEQTYGDMTRMREKGWLGYLQDLDGEEFKAVKEGIAQLNALTAVYQDNSKMSEALMGFKKAIGDLSEGALGFDILSQFSMPFVKTPANVVDRAIDYSPLGLIRNAVRTGKETINKNTPGFNWYTLNQNRFVNETARNLIGTGLMAGAGAAVYNGAMSDKYSKDKDEKAAQKEAGEQEYALNLPGNYQMDIGWVPIVGSNSVAAAAAVDAAKDPELSALDKVTAGTAAGGKAMFDQSMFQGLQRLFGQGDSYNSDAGIVSNMINTVKQGTTQAIPSLARQTAQVIDPYERDLANGNYDINSIKNTIPFVRETLQPKVDSEGNYIRQNQGRNIGMKILEDMILPGKITQVKPKEMNTEAQRLQAITGNADAYVPKATRGEITTDDHEPTDKEYTDYQVDRNKSMTEAGKAMIKTDYYKSAAPEKQEELLNKVYSKIKGAKKAEYTGKESDDKLIKLYNESGHKKQDADALVNRMIQNEQISEAGLKATDKLYDYLDNGGKLEDYTNFKKNITTIGEDGKEHTYKKTVMEELSKLPEDKRQAMFDLSGEKFNAEEQKAYDAGGINAALRVWKKNQKEADKKAREAAKKKRQAAAQAGVSINKLDDLQEELASYGAQNSATTVQYYSHAKQEIPSLTTKQYTQKLHEIGGEDYKIAQKEMLHYFDTHNLTDSERTQLWKAYGNWSTIPVLKKNGTWGTKKAK